MKQCKCGSYAINHNCHDRDGSDGDLCDVCYWKKRANEYKQQADSLKEKNNRYTKFYFESCEDYINLYENYKEIGCLK
jgi:hypothetical protein